MSAPGSATPLPPSPPSVLNPPATVAIIPCSDDFRHPDGTIVKMRRLPDLFFPAESLESWGGPAVIAAAEPTGPVPAFSPAVIQSLSGTPSEAPKARAKEFLQTAQPPRLGEGSRAAGEQGGEQGGDSAGDEGVPEARVAAMHLVRVRSPPSPARYPQSSDLRCHQCLLQFSCPPLFIPVSLQTEPVSRRLLVTVDGHYCCQACRNRALESMSESYRLNVMRVDLVCLGRVLDMAEAAPRPADLVPFGGTVTLETFMRLRARTALTPEDQEMLAAAVPGRAIFGFRPRFVRETYYGTLEGGCGEEGALQKLLLLLPQIRTQSTRRPDTHAKHPGREAARGEGLRQGAKDSGNARRALLGDEGIEREGWREAGDAWGLRFVGRSPSLRSEPQQAPSLRPDSWSCQWCTLRRPGDRVPVEVPLARDPCGTVHLCGAFCSTGCALTHLLHESRFGVSPSAYTERLGIMSWLAVHRHGVAFHARLACAPHRLELIEFGGDLTRAEFDAQKVLPDLHTCLETPPFCTARMAPNYTRPGVVCDLSRVGESSGTSEKFSTSSFEGRFQKTHGLFDALVLKA